MKKLSLGRLLQINTVSKGVWLVSVAMIFALNLSIPVIDIQTASAEGQDFNAFIGSWIRPDGGYVIRITNVNADGTVEAGYFNPNPIHVAEARVSMQEDLMKLYMRLEGRGYPGSTYTLYYYAEKDALAGFYYQAAMDQTFEVVFLRQNK